MAQPGKHSIEDRDMTGVRFDKTINLGHVLTFIGFIVSIAVTASAFDKRMAIIEEVQRQQITKDSQQDARQRELSEDMKAWLTDIRKSIEKLGDKLDRYQERSRKQPWPQNQSRF